MTLGGEARDTGMGAGQAGGGFTRAALLAWLDTVLTPDEWADGAIRSGGMAVATDDDLNDRILKYPSGRYGDCAGCDPQMTHPFASMIVVDTETGGLDPDYHPIWQLSWKVWSDGWQGRTLLLDHDAERIDTWVRENTSYERRMAEGTRLWPAEQALRKLMIDAQGRHIVGMVPSFDEERLRRLALAHGIEPTWHYHLIDVETLIVGRLLAQGVTVPLPWRSDDLCRAIGVDPDPLTRHDAEGDVALNIACLEALVGVIVPGRYEVDDPGHAFAYTVSVELNPETHRPEVVAIEARVRSDGRALSARALQADRLGDILVAASRAATVPVMGKANRQGEAVDAAGPLFEPRRPGRPPAISREELTIVADAWHKAQSDGEPVHAAIRRALDRAKFPGGSTKRRLERCRELGMIPPANGTTRPKGVQS